MDVWYVLAGNLVVEDQVQLVVVTAPGADVLPFDPRKCRVPERHSCSGRLGCRIDERARDEWESHVQHQWRLLWRAVLMRLARAGYSSPALGFVDEDQRRGAWHRNVCLRWGSSSVAAHRALVELAPRYGFGFVDRQLVRMDGVRAAGYLAGYLTGRNKGTATLAAHVQRMPSRRRCWYVSSSSTRSTGITMTSLRNGRKLYGASMGWCNPPASGWAVVDHHVVDAATGELHHGVWRNGP